MAITLRDVEHVAALAKLSFTDREKETLVSQLNEILRYMELLNALDTANVEPLSRVIPTGNVLRPDDPRPSLDGDEALSNAPAKTGKFFRVPKVIGDR